MYYNLSFTNSNVIKEVHVKGDKFVETFGIIGGLVALIIFGLGVFPRSFNNYRMRYLIGKELYLFDILKSKQQRNLSRGRAHKTEEEARNLKEMNNLN